METVQINLERYLPQCLAENWSIQRLAEEAGCGPKTALHFLNEKRAEVSEQTHIKIVGLTNKMWNALAKRAQLDRDHLERLNEHQEAGLKVDQGTVSTLVKRMIAILNMGKSMAPREENDPRNRFGAIVQSSNV